QGLRPAVEAFSGACARKASREAFCSSIVLMLSCIMLRLICSQLSITLSSSILRASSAGSSVANIAAGLGNGMPATGGAPGAPGAAPGNPKPGIGTPNGFHIFCMNSEMSLNAAGGSAFFVSAIRLPLMGLGGRSGEPALVIVPRPSRLGAAVPPIGSEPLQPSLAHVLLHRIESLGRSETGP